MSNLLGADLKFVLWNNSAVFRRTSTPTTQQSGLVFGVRHSRIWHLAFGILALGILAFGVLASWHLPFGFGTSGECLTGVRVLNTYMIVEHQYVFTWVWKWVVKKKG